MSEELAGQGYITDWLPICDLLFGRGILTPGGKGNIARIVGDHDLRDKRVLDYGSGVGGGSAVLARDYGATVVGFEIEASYVEYSSELASEAGVSDRVEFRHFEPGTLPVADASFDVFYTSGVLCHIEDQSAVLREAYRALKPGGWLMGYDWFVLEPDAVIDAWTEFVGFTLFRESLKGRLDSLGEAGFEALEGEDATGWYHRRIDEELELLQGPLFDTTAALTSAETRDYFIDEWRHMKAALETGKIEQGYFRGRKPG